MSISGNTRAPAALPVTRRPSVGWYWAAGMLLVAGSVAAAMSVVDAVIGLNDDVDRFRRTSVPGRISTPIDHPNTYYVCYEGVTGRTLDRLGVTVTNPSGDAVAAPPSGAIAIVVTGVRRSRPRTPAKETAPHTCDGKGT